MLLPPGYAVRLFPPFPSPPPPRQASIATVTEVLPSLLRVVVADDAAGLYAYWVTRSLADAYLARAGGNNSPSALFDAINDSYEMQENYAEYEQPFVTLVAAAATCGAGLPVNMLTPHQGTTAVLSIHDGELVLVCCAVDGLNRISMRLRGDPRQDDSVIEWELEGCNAAITEANPLVSDTWLLRDANTDTVPATLKKAVAMLAAPYLPPDCDPGTPAKSAP